MLFRLGVLTALVGASSAAAGTKYVKNDTFSGSGSINTGVSFGELQGAGVLFSPSPADYPLNIIGVDVFIATYAGGGPGLPGAYVVSLWDESKGTLSPPTLFDGGYYQGIVNMLSVQFTTSSTMLNRVTLPSRLVVDAGQVFVMVAEQNQTSLDDTTIALDNGPLAPGANWYFDGSGYFHPVDLPDGGRPYGINQNWIIRLVLDVPDVPVIVTSINPASGPNSVDTDVTITGANFELGAQAFAGTTPLTLRSVAATTIEATVPAGLTPGQYDLVVRNPSTIEGTLPGGYRVLLPDGGTGMGGGAGGGAGGGGNTGGGAGGGAAGGGTGGGSGGGSSGVFAVVSVTPEELYADDGARLVITGSGFESGAQLLLGTTLIEGVEWKSNAVLNATVPPKAVAAGVFDVTVLNLSGVRATLPMGLTVHAGAMAKAGCGCGTVEPSMLALAALGLLALRRRRSSCALAMRLAARPAPS